MELIENCYVINLEKNVDRLQLVTSELKKLGIPFTRFNAIKHENGNIGCCLSHIECLKLAQQKKLPYVMIWEDDNMLVGNREEFYNKINQFYITIKKWDVLLISANNYRPFENVNDYCIKVKNAQCANAYIVKRHYYQTLIDIFTVSKTQLLQGRPPQLFMSDIIWKYLQYKDQWYMLIPNYITQRPYYSDIEKKMVNYDRFYQNYDKNGGSQNYYHNMKTNIEKLLLEDQK